MSTHERILRPVPPLADHAPAVDGLLDPGEDPRVVALLRTMGDRLVEPPDEVTRRRHLRAMRRAVQSQRGRRRRRARGATAGAAVLVLALGAADVLPGGMQRAVADAAGTVGVPLPSPTGSADDPGPRGGDARAEAIEPVAETAPTDGAASLESHGDATAPTESEGVVPPIRLGGGAHDEPPAEPGPDHRPAAELPDAVPDHAAAEQARGGPDPPAGARHGDRPSTRGPDPSGASAGGSPAPGPSGRSPGPPR